jgi:hypothetical protein
MRPVMDLPILETKQLEHSKLQRRLPVTTLTLATMLALTAASSAIGTSQLAAAGYRPWSR